LVRIEREGPVTTVTLDRKAVKNAVDRTTAQALAAAFRAFDADPGARVAVLHGDHGTFCAGADLKVLAAGAIALAAAGGNAATAEVGNRVAPDGDGPMGPTRMVLGKPVIAAIAGHAVAGGLELALWCDLRVAEEDAVLGVFCRRFGVPLIDGGTIRLPRLIGLSRALDLILTGRPVHADEALAIGLVNRVVPRGEALAAAQQLAHQLAALPQAALRADRMSAYTQFDLAFDAALLNELEHGRHALAEGLEGAQRFAAGAGRHGEAT
jgi:enoyl-CoA hydratase